MLFCLVHIFFDDAFKSHRAEEEASQVNDFVATFVSVVNKAAT